MTPALLKKIIEELQPLLEGSLLSSIRQSDDKTLDLKIFTGREQASLLVSCHPKFSRLHLSEAKRAHPPRPLRFCSFLRSRIEGARIDSISQLEDERIAILNLTKKHDGEAASYKLVAELTGKSSNVILLDKDGVVLDALKYFKKGLAARPVEAGLPLTPLPKPETSNSPIEVTPERNESWNRAAERYFDCLEEKEGFTLDKQKITSALASLNAKYRRLLENLLKDKKNAEDSSAFSRLGDLIMANYAKIKKGDTSVTLKNIFDEAQGELAVKLDPQLNAQENASRYYKKSKKASTAISLLKTRLPSTEKRIAELEILLNKALAATKASELEKIENLLKNNGILPKTQDARTTAKSSEKSSLIRKSRTADGFDILIGRSAKANDALIKEYAGDEDLWFHAKGYAGAHVLLKFKSKTKPFTEKSIHEAAVIAAENSKASTSSKVEVICAKAKNVKKPKGAKAGAVTVDEYKSVLVTIRNKKA